MEKDTIKNLDVKFVSTAWSETVSETSPFSQSFFTQRKCGAVITTYIECVISTDVAGWYTLGNLKYKPKENTYGAGLFFQNNNRSEVHVFDIQITTDGRFMAYLFANSSGLKIRQTFVFIG